MFCVICSAVPLHAEPAPDSCASLSKEFDAADKSGVPAEKLKEAMSERRHARGLCATGNIGPGIRSLKKALALIGIEK